MESALQLRNGTATLLATMRAICDKIFLRDHKGRVKQSYLEHVVCWQPCSSLASKVGKYFLQKKVGKERKKKFNLLSSSIAKI